MAKEIWQHLFEFYLVETKKPENEKPVIQTAVKEQILKHKKFSIVNISPAVKQLLSHQLINGQFIHIRVSLKPRIKENYVSVPKEKLKSYPFPKLINDYITGSFEEMK